MSNFFLFGVILLAVHSSLVQGQNDWESFKKQYNKTYNETAPSSSNGKGQQHLTEAQAKANFNSNLAAVNAHNKKHAEGKVSYTLGINQYSDLSSTQFARTVLNGIQMPSKAELDKVPIANAALLSGPGVGAAASLDWRTLGAVTPVKNQASCGSCWAFSATGVLEGAWFIKNRQLIPESEQNLLDCSRTNYGNYGCGGGWPSNALLYVKNNPGIDKSSYYPYVGVQGATCRYSSTYRAATVTNVYALTAGDENALLNAVTKGPVSIALDATPLQSYRSGVLDTTACSKSVPNHAVLLVGYGTDAATGKNFWLMKNSWSTGWGEAGYARLVRGKNMCGLANWAVYPTV